MITNRSEVTLMEFVVIHTSIFQFAAGVSLTMVVTSAILYIPSTTLLRDECVCHTWVLHLPKAFGCSLPV
jgi:hypothetical protein